MTVTVIKPQEVETRPTFKTGELVISTSDSKNIYFVTGKGSSSSTFAGVRLSGCGSFAEYSTEYLKSAVELFKGELVIRNEQA